MLHAEIVYVPIVMELLSYSGTLPIVSYTYSEQIEFYRDQEATLKVY